jgi:uncharacterized damage-inducible protein DinB
MRARNLRPPHPSCVLIFRMKEKVQQYVARIQSLVGSTDPLTIIEATPEKLAQAVNGLSAAALDHKPAPGKWSIRQILAHLADTEMVMSTRFHWAAAEPGKAITGFDQDRWAATGKYDRVPLELSLTTFTAARHWTLEFIRRLSPQECDAAFVQHEERGKESLQRLLVMIAGHDLNHLKQIAELANAGRSQSTSARP